jgi:hypothetical protein
MDESGDNIDRRIADMEQEIAELDARIRVLGDRLGAGDTTVRSELNPLIRRRHELGKHVFELEEASGRVSPDQTMYGPPWMFRAEAGPPLPEPEEPDGHPARPRSVWARLTARLFGGE